MFKYIYTSWELCNFAILAISPIKNKTALHQAMDHVTVIDIFLRVKSKTCKMNIASLNLHFSVKRHKHAPF